MFRRWVVQGNAEPRHRYRRDRIHCLIWRRYVWGSRCCICVHPLECRVRPPVWVTPPSLPPSLPPSPPTHPSTYLTPPAASNYSHRLLLRLWLHTANWGFSFYGNTLQTPPPLSSPPPSPASSWHRPRDFQESVSNLPSVAINLFLIGPIAAALHSRRPGWLHVSPRFQKGNQTHI